MVAYKYIEKTAFHKLELVKSSRCKCKHIGYQLSVRNFPIKFDWQIR